MMGLTAGVAMAQPSTEPVEPQEGCEYFDSTGHNLCEPFEAYWNTNGGLEVFGYPVTEAVEETNADLGVDLLTQYFERERLEYHPENEGTEYEILLGRLGADLLERQGVNWFEFPKDDPDDANYFDETGFAVPPEFAEYWSSHGLDLGDEGISYRESLALFGYPISPLQTETNMAGDTVPTQWFERARFELHDDGVVLLGLLGSELLAPEEEPEPVDFEVVAEGLNGPRGIFVEDDGSLLVAESGVAGDECVITTPPGVEEGELCMGTTGAITRIADGEMTTAVADLPSSLFGGFMIGPQDVVVVDDQIYSVIGTHGAEEEFGRAGLLIQADAEGEWTTVADFLAWIGERNPEARGYESNAYSLVTTSDGEFVVSDAAANALLNVTTDGEISVLAEFEERMAELPPAFQEPDGPTEIPMDAVPTGMAIGPDGAYYVGELTGFPFPEDGARIWRVTPEGESEVYAEGFTNVIDVAFDSQGRLYVLEMVSGGLLNLNPEEPATAAGTLYRIEEDGSRTVVANEGLTFATGLTIGPDDTIYVSNIGHIPGEGQVVAIPASGD